eukprot:6475198-Amphidinium_carterae.1
MIIVAIVSVVKFLNHLVYYAGYVDSTYKQQISIEPNLEHKLDTKCLCCLNGKLLAVEVDDICGALRHHDCSLAARLRAFGRGLLACRAV